MIEIKQLTVYQMHKEGQHLLKDHYEELTLHKEKIKLNVDWSNYYNLASQGRLLSLGAWEDGELIGYSVFILSRHLHYMDCRMALNDVLFLRKDKRKGRLGIRLIQESEKWCKKLGVTKILWHCKHNTTAEKLLRRMNYVSEEVTVGKLL